MGDLPERIFVTRDPATPDNPWGSWCEKMKDTNHPTTKYIRKDKFDEALELVKRLNFAIVAQGCDPKYRQSKLSERLQALQDGQQFIEEWSEE